MLLRRGRAKFFVGLFKMRGDQPGIKSNSTEFPIPFAGELISEREASETLKSKLSIVTLRRSEGVEMHRNEHPVKWLWLLVLLIPIVALLSTRPMSAQTVYGSIYGTVLDKSGAVVTNATIVVKSQQKETSFQAQTNATGEYRIEHLIPDAYNVTISATGFKTFTVNGLQVNAGDTPKVDANLEVGSVNQSVTVSATAEELLQTEHQDVSLSIEEDTIQEPTHYG